MKKHALQKLFESVEAECRSYSGRGMFGKACLGVDIGRDCSIGEVFGNVLEAIGTGDCALNEEGLEQAGEAMRRMRYDQMGLGMIYYFPGIPYVEDEGDGEEVTLRQRQINSLSRDGCVRLLEGSGIQCYDSESVEVLREAVAANVEDGTISPQDLEGACA